jgi:hypothetical protein
VIPFLTYDEAEPLEVAIMVTIQEAIASFRGIPRRTNKGTKILAPPKPVRAPRKPTGAEMRRRETMFSIRR